MKPQGKTYVVVETVKRTYKVTMSPECAQDAHQRGGSVEAMKRAAEFIQTPTPAADIALVDTETSRDVIDIGPSQNSDARPVKILGGQH